MSPICAPRHATTYTALVMCGLSQPTVCQAAYDAQVISRLDVCNSLPVDLCDTMLHHLERVQNVCARVVLWRGKYEQVTPILRELHWSPIKSRVQYKVLLVSHTCLHGLGLMT